MKTQTWVRASKPPTLLLVNNLVSFIKFDSVQSGRGNLPFSAPTSCLFDSSTFTPRPNFTVHNPGSVWTHEPLTFCANGPLTSRRRLPACACLIWSLPPLVSVCARSRGASVFAGQVFSSTHSSVNVHTGADARSLWAARHCPRNKPDAPVTLAYISLFFLTVRDVEARAWKTFSSSLAHMHSWLIGTYITR